MKKALSQYNTVAGTTPAYTQAVPASAHKYAELSMLGGKTQPWNQLAPITSFTFAAEAWAQHTLTGYAVSGHKHYCCASFDNRGGSGFFFANYGGDAISAVMEANKIEAIVTPSGTTIKLIRNAVAGSVTNATNCYAIDLTVIFGSGNEPTSLTDPRIAQIKAYAAAHPEYNAGALVSAKVDEVKSVGANVWDEQWEIGGIDPTTGQNAEESIRIRSKNYIKVLPNTTYYITSIQWQYLLAYDASKTYIGTISSSADFHSFTTNANQCYLRFCCESAYGTTYNHDIQICLNTYAEKTTYHPYTAFSLPIPTAVQNLDGYGQSAGTVYNYVDLEPVKYSNMKSVDLGTLTWTYWSADGEWYTDGLSGIAVEPVSASIPLNAICTTYPISSYSGKYTGAMYLLSGRLYCKNYSSTTSPTGILHYEATSGGSDYNAKLYHKRVGSVDLGSLTWAAGPGNSWTTTGLSNLIKRGLNDNQVYPFGIQCDTIPLIRKNTSDIWITNTIAVSTSGQVYINNGSTTNRPTGTLFYELASEQILDVTDLVNDYALLNIYDSGTVTFHQQGGTEMSVPNALYFATAQRTNGTTFGDANSVDDLALIQQSVSVQPALPKTNLIEIPGADGYIDLTEALGVGIKYNAREIVWQFALPPAAVWHEKQSEVSNAINGKRCRITLDNDPEWYYEGRITVEKYESDKLLHRISVVATCNPYKISKISGGRSL